MYFKTCSRPRVQKENQQKAIVFDTPEQLRNDYCFYRECGQLVIQELIPETINAFIK